MTLEHINYVPTLGIRPSEMKALEFLPGATKDKLKPCIILAPWGNSTYLENSIKRFEKAYPKKSYFLDIERDYKTKKQEDADLQETDVSEKRPALQKMEDLQDSENGYKNWIDFISEHENIHPCIQYKNQDLHQIQQQIQEIKGLGRSYCLRIHTDGIPKNINDMASILSGETDCTIILEGGWVKDPLTLMTEFSGIISTQLNILNPDFPIVVSCTSFPKGFTSISGVQETPFGNRLLINQLRENTGKNIVYGDWGSARPREKRDGGQRPVSRIDYPTKDAWYIARKQGDWGYQLAAEQVVKHNVWQNELGVWGQEMIERTVKNQTLGIDTPSKNAASRINIHLHLQAFYDEDRLDTISLEEDFED